MTGAGPAPAVPPVRLRVADVAVARIAADVAARVPGVVALQPRAAPLGTVEPLLGRDAARPPGGVTAAVGDGSAEVSVAVVTRLGYNCRDLAQAVQQAVAAELIVGAGLTARVTVTITEVRIP